MIIALALVAAVLLGIGFVLQQRAASQMPISDMLRPRLIIDLMHSPQWLCGIGSMVAGQLLSAFVLGRTSVSLVEPLLAANLLVALLLAAAITRRPLRRSDWIGCLVLGGGLSAFIVVGRPTAVNAEASAVRHWLVIAIIAGVAAALVLTSRMRPLGEQATMLAGAAGCLAGLQDGFTRNVMMTVQQDPGSVIRYWQPYAVVGVALTVILLEQSAFKAGTLRQALPAVTVGEPLAGIAFGVVAFGDQLRTEPWAIAVEVLGLAGMVAGVYVLATSDLLSHAVGEPTSEHPAAEGDS